MASGQPILAIKRAVNLSRFPKMGLARLIGTRTLRRGCRLWLLYGVFWLGWSWSA